MLAGDVLVSVVEGRLIVEGDQFDNNIAITAGTEAGAFVVTGRDNTTVHEQGQAPGTEVVVTGVERGARINMGAGADTVALSDLSLRGHVSISTGVGDDEVIVGGDNVQQTALTTIEASVRLRDLSINTGENDDHVTVGSAAIHGFLNIQTGIGNDTVALGGAADPAANLTIPLPDNGLSDARLQVHGAAHVALGEGNDDIHVNHARAFAMFIFGHDDVDTASIESSHIGHLGMFMGDGEDNVSLVDSAFATLAVSLGGGNDQLSTGGLTAHFAVLLGGDGEDTHNVLAASEFRHELIRGFELPPGVVNTILRPRFGRPLNVLSALGSGLLRR